MLLLTFFREFKARFFHSGLNQKRSTLRTGWLSVLRHNLHSPKILKSAIIFDISRYSNWLFSVTTGLSSSITISEENFTSVEVDSIEKPFFDPFIRILLVQNFQKVFSKNDPSRLSEWCFSVTTGFISFMRITIGNLTLIGEVSIQISVTWFFIKSRTLPRIESSWQFFWLLSFFNLIFLYNYRLVFFVKGLNWKLYSWRGRFDWKARDFDPCVKVLIIQNFQKVVIKNDSSRISERCFFVTTGFISVMRVTISNLRLREKDSIQISVRRFFASKSGHSQKSKVFSLPHVDVQSHVSF